MSNEAFILAEAELLHALGGLLVCAYESCVDVEKSRRTQLLDAEEELTYNQPIFSVRDMFKSPPPPFYPKNHHDYNPDVALVYTLVPGQIEAAAEQRGITPSKVYGDVWVAISGFDPEEEEETEKSYYYKETYRYYDSDYDSEESDMNISDSDLSENEENIDSEMDTSRENTV